MNKFNCNLESFNPALNCKLVEPLDCTGGIPVENQWLIECSLLICKLKLESSLPSITSILFLD